VKNYRNSDYAVNKFSKSIVYQSVEDAASTITLEDFLTENLGMTEDDFNYWKAISDGDYLERVTDECRITRRDVSIHGLEETMLCAALSPEELIFDQHKQVERKNRRRELAAQALDNLTEIQRRRYIQHHVRRLSTWQISHDEGTNQKSVYESLVSAEKKIQKILAKL